MRDGPRRFTPSSTWRALLRIPLGLRTVRLRGFHPLRPAVPRRSAWSSGPRRGPTTPGGVPPRFGLIPVRSPLLGESRLLSFPPGTEMFQFPGLARAPRDQRSIDSSPGPIAASHALEPPGAKTSPTRPYPLGHTAPARTTPPRLSTTAGAIPPLRPTNPPANVSHIICRPERPRPDPPQPPLKRADARQGRNAQGDFVPHRVVKDQLLPRRADSTFLSFSSSPQLLLHPYIIGRWRTVNRSRSLFSSGLLSGVSPWPGRPAAVRGELILIVYSPARGNSESRFSSVPVVGLVPRVGPPGHCGCLRVGHHPSNTSRHTFGTSGQAAA